MKHALRIAVAAMPVLVACSVHEEAPELGESATITYNSLAPAALLDNGDGLEALAGDALHGAATALVDSASGRDLLSYLVRCALAVGQTAAFPRAGAPDLIYPGVIGFAPEWAAAPLDASGRRLVTGCLMAHVNAFETEVPISIRSEGIADANLAEKLLFPAQELTVYGDYFAPAAERAMYVCFGKAVAQTLGGGGLLDGLPSYLDLRVCSTSENCGFNRVGACFRWPTVPSVTTSACEEQAGNLYDSCHEAPIEVEPTAAWEDTVTVYLQPGHLVLLVAEYLELLCELSNGLICNLIDL